MATEFKPLISKGILVMRKAVELTNLLEISELGNGEAEQIEVTTLADESRKYTDGLKNYGDSITLKFLYDEVQFLALANAVDEEAAEYEVQLPCINDCMLCTFNATHSIKLDSVGVNAPLTYTVTIKPTGAMTWGYK